MMQTPPDTAVILFDGKDLSNWTKLDEGAPAWEVADGAMTVTAGEGDIVSREKFTDFLLHLGVHDTRYA